MPLPVPDREGHHDRGQMIELTQTLMHCQLWNAVSAEAKVRLFHCLFFFASLNYTFKFSTPEETFHHQNSNKYWINHLNFTMVSDSAEKNFNLCYFTVQKLKTIQECTGELWDIYSKKSICIVNIFKNEYKKF